MPQWSRDDRGRFKSRSGPADSLGQLPRIEKAPAGRDCDAAARQRSILIGCGARTKLGRGDYRNIRGFKGKQSKQYQRKRIFVNPEEERAFWEHLQSLAGDDYELIVTVSIYRRARSRKRTG